MKNKRTQTLTPIEIPANRADLAYEFGSTAKLLLVDNKDIDVQDFIDILIPNLVSAVPDHAFDPIQPFDKGVLFFHQEINEEEVVDFQHDLLRAHYNLKPGVPITLNLSSIGGSVFAGLALASTIYQIQREGREVNVHIQGVAMSMASALAQVANKRTMEPTAHFMLHEVSYGMRGSTAEHEEERSFTVKLQDSLYSLYSARTGKPIKYYQDKTRRRNWYMDATEALAEGLVDEITAAPLFSLPPQVVPKATKSRNGRKSDA